MDRLATKTNKVVLVIDTGDSIVGVCSVFDGVYRPYTGSQIQLALDQILSADELITYCGDYDLGQLATFAGGQERFSYPGTHVDMNVVCWSGRIRGSSLLNTYRKQFGEPPLFEDSYVGSNERDVYMTLELWKAWREGRLVVEDGLYR